MEPFKRESSRVKRRKREERIWREHHKQHVERIHGMKPTISGSIHNEQYDYLHVQLRLKKLQMEEERFASIDKENRQLLERIINAVGDIPAPCDPSPRAGTSPRKSMDKEAIEKQNAKLYERIEKIKPYISSTASTYRKLNELREKQKRLEEQKIMQENKILKEKIDAARHRINLTPPNRHNIHTSFADRYDTEAKEIDRENLKMGERLQKILQSGATFQIENDRPLLRKNKVVKSYSADNRERKKRLEQIKSTIDVNKSQQPQYPPKPSNPRAEKERIDRENEELQKRIFKIMNSHNPMYKTDDRILIKESPRKKHIEAWNKAIEKENKILEERLKHVAVKVSTHQKNTSTYVPYDDPYKEENKHKRERILKIKRGEVPSPLNEPNDLEDDNEEEQNDGAKEETKKEKKKQYKTPAGYHKKFRKKRRKPQKKTKDDSDDSGSEFETDTSDSD